MDRVSACFSTFIHVQPTGTRRSGTSQLRCARASGVLRRSKSAYLSSVALPCVLRLCIFCLMSRARALCPEPVHSLLLLFRCRRPCSCQVQVKWACIAPGWLIDGGGLDVLPSPRPPCSQPHVRRQYLALYKLHLFQKTN